MLSQPWRASLLAIFLVCAACSGNKEEPRETAGESSGEPAKIEVADTPEEAKEGIEERLDRLIAEAEKLPRAEFDPAALSASLGKDPEKHFEWVRDRTWWAPYRGLLRGSQGVMLDRVGSNLDRAVLLGDLLRRAGVTVRLAHADLSEDQARELLGKMRPIPANRFAEAADTRSAALKQAEANAESLVESQTQTILAALKRAGSTQPVDDGTAVAAMRDHWWVEHEANGEWLALDVALPDAKPGETLARATATSPWKAADAAPAIPDSEWHVVDIRVVLERYDAGETTEMQLLATSLRPAERLGSPLRLRHAPVPWPESLSDGDPKAFNDAALAVEMWIPVLKVGDEEFVHTGFTNEGKLHAELEKAATAMSRAGGLQVASGMDMALGGFSPDEARPAATAEWIDYEIIVPGSKSQKFRRPVFDLLGPARRASNAADFDGTPDLRKLERFEALWAPTDILLQSSGFTGEFVADLQASDLVENQKALKDLAREEDPDKARQQATELFDRIEIWGPLPNFALWRSSLGANAGDSFIDKPNVLHHRAGRAVVNAEPGTYRELIDVAFNPAGARLGSTGSPFEVRVRQGVADTVAEMLALGADVGTAENTASVFNRLPANNNRGLLIAAGDEAAARALPWPEDETARVAADVGAGYMVLVPREAVMIKDQQRVGWWRVDPASGETVGVMDSGYHMGKAEYQLTLLVITIAPFLARPGNLERADAARRLVSQNAGQMLSRGQARHLALADLSRQLLADLAVLAQPGNLSR